MTVRVADRVDPDFRRLSPAMLDAKERLGLDATARYHVECDMDANRSDVGVRAAIDRLWLLRPAPPALICFNDMIAAEVEDLLAQRDIRCPQDISILSRGSLDEPSK